MPPVPFIPIAATSITKEITDESAEFSLNLLDWERFSTLLIIASSVLVLVSAGQSRTLIAARNLPEEEFAALREKVTPIRTAMGSLLIGILALVILTWASVARFAQRRELIRLGDTSLTLWPDAVIVVGFLISLVATGFKALGVGKRYKELAPLVII